jgi:hypothetical protein
MSWACPTKSFTGFWKYKGKILPLHPHIPMTDFGEFPTIFNQKGGNFRLGLIVDSL